MMAERYPCQLCGRESDGPAFCEWCGTRFATASPAPVVPADLDAAEPVQVDAAPAEVDSADPAETATCPTCGTEVPARRFCFSCGTRLVAGLDDLFVNAASASTYIERPGPGS